MTDLDNNKISSIESGENSAKSRELENLLSSLNSAVKRLNELRSQKKLRDTDSIWELYCDVETAVAISKFVFEGLPKLEIHRKLAFSNKDSPTRMIEDQLLRRYDLIESEIEAAKSSFSLRQEAVGLEHGRRARDELKIMLLAARKSRQVKE